MRRVLFAGVLGLLGTALAAAIVMFGGTGPAVLGGALRDRWAIALAPVSPGFSVVIRDAAAEQKLGAGAWDRAVIARVIGGLTLNGATAIGIDASLGSPSPPGRGGAASDALLREAIARPPTSCTCCRPCPVPSPAACGSATRSCRPIRTASCAVCR